MLVDRATPARLREAYLQLRASDPGTDAIADPRRLTAVPSGATVILVLASPISAEDVTWLNLNRPIVSDRRLRIVLWCEPATTAALARGAPDLFDWIMTRVDCPPAPVAHAVADVQAAIRARAPGVAWDGPGLEGTLAAIRPHRPVRRVAVASYRSMLDVLTAREPGWLLLDGIDTAFQLRRLRWAMAEAGRRVIVFRPIEHDFEPTAPGWWTVSAALVPFSTAAAAITAVGGTGRIAVLTGLAPDACAYACFALRHGVASDELEALLAAAPDPRAALRDLAARSGWTASEVLDTRGLDPELGAMPWAIAREAARHQRDDDPVITALHAPSLRPSQWATLGKAALDAGDYQVAIRWLTEALKRLPADVSDRYVAAVLLERGRAHRLAGELAAARRILEDACKTAEEAGEPTLVAMVAAELGYALLDQGEPRLALERMTEALRRSKKLGDPKQVANLLDVYARALVATGDLTGARRHLDDALARKQKAYASKDAPAVALTLSLRGAVLAEQGDEAGSRRDLERALSITERAQGSEHPSVGAILTALARVDRLTRRLRDAGERLDRAIAIQRRTLGEDHPEVAETLVTRAGVLIDSGDFDGALTALQEALVIQHKAVGVDGGLAGARAQRELARVSLARGDLPGAIDHLEQALATLRRIDDQHPDIASTCRELERLQALQRSQSALTR